MVKGRTEKFYSDLSLAVMSGRCLSDAEKGQLSVCKYFELAECSLFSVAILEYLGEVKKGSLEKVQKDIRKEAQIAIIKAAIKDSSAIEKFKREFVV